MKLIIISGRSGSGKSTALQALEDVGFYCIDNLPATLLPDLVNQILRDPDHPNKLAVSIDARNQHSNLKQFPEIFKRLRETRSEEHTSELQSHHDLVCRLLLEKKKKIKLNHHHYNSHV